MLLTAAQVVKAFGDPSPFVLPDGHVSAGWEAILAPFPLPQPLALAGSAQVVTTVRCNAKVLPFMKAALDAVERAGLWSALYDFGGCYCWRLQRGAAVPSRHSWGIAVDVNVAHNPFGSAPNMDSGIVAAFKAQGFVWGGDWTHRTDGMHFEAGTGLVARLS